MKRGRARLTNRRALELWGGASGSGRLQYRWLTAKRLLRDIFDGLDRTKRASRPDLDVNVNGATDA